MKFFIQIAAVATIMAFTSGCSTSEAQLKPISGLDGGVCNNPKCQCPKPCQCGASCQCGMNGNSTQLKN